MPKLRERKFQVGEYWLGQRSGIPTWFRCWFDEQTRQTRRASLNTTSFEEAKVALTKWFIAKQAPTVEPTTLAAVLASYYEERGKYVATEDAVRTSSRYWIEHFGGDVPAIDACEMDRISEFRDSLLRAGHSPGYVNRILSVGRAALRRAYGQQKLPLEPIVKGIDGVRGEPIGRAMSPLELRGIYREFEAEHFRRFLVLGLGTGSRPGALLELKWDQVKLDDRAIFLNPPNRKQTKKRRAKVPICGELAKHLRSWGEEDGWMGLVIHSQGAPVTTLNVTWRRLRSELGFDRHCNPYSLRHSVAKWLRSQSVSPWEVATLLGHAMPGLTITERYATLDAQYMAATCQALDKLLLDVAHS